MKYLSTIFAIVALFCITTKADDEDFNKTDLRIKIRDPFAFDRADSMYSVMDAIAFDKAAEILVSNISTNSDKSVLVEDNIIWNDLLKLEPYRKNIEVQAFIKHWAEKQTIKIKNTKHINSVKALKKFCEAYKLFDYAHASEIGRKSLLDEPGNIDLRNNFALTQMHLNNDLAAQLEFEIIAILDSTYIPALVNLTVIYERMGKSTEAHMLSQKLLYKGSHYPIVLFNASWYMNRDSNYVAADSLLKKTVELDNHSKYRSFYQLNKKQLSYQIRQGALFDIGIFRKYGFRESPEGEVWSVILFLMASIVFFIILYKTAAWLITLWYISFWLPGLFYTLFWGGTIEWSLFIILFYIVSIVVIVIRYFSNT